MFQLYVENDIWRTCYRIYIITSTKETPEPYPTLKSFKLL